MTQSGGAVKCVVTSGQEMLGDAGGEQALCTAIEQALSGSSVAAVVVNAKPRSRFEVEVTTAGGKKLPTMNFMEADRPLDRKTFEHLAAAVASYVGTAAAT